MSLLHKLDDGKIHRISQEDFDYFLDVLPPVAMRFAWNGERWHYGFSEGYDYVFAFKKQGGACFAQKTNLLNPHECGVTIEKQQQELAEKLCQEKEATRAASWIPTWLKIGKANPWIRQAADPAFNTQSFHPCLNDAELLDKFEHGNWCLGQAFFLGDTCFVQQVNGGDEWLTIKQDTPFESISFGRIIREKGREAAQAILERIKAASVAKCRELDY